MRYLVVLVLVGCVSSSDPNAAEDPLDSEASQSLTAHAIKPATIPACTVNTWCVETAPVTGTPILHAISAVSASDVFAVGDAGTIIERTGGNWVAMTSGTTADLRGVWALSSTDVWASGVGGVILHYDGTSWSSLSSGSTVDADAVWASGPSDVWFAGSSVVLRWNGSTFTKYTFAGTMLAVSGNGPNDVWVTGENTNVHHWNGSTWTTLTPGSGTSSYLTVLAVGSNDIWATDFMPTKQGAHYNGSTWALKNTTNAIYVSLSDFSSSDIWAVGGNKVGHWNGTAWSTPTSPLGTSANLWSVTTPTSHIWVVGDNALIGHMPL